MATATPKIKQVRFTYKVSNKGVRFIPSKLHLNKGQLVTFVCDQGTLDLLLRPTKAWDPPTYRTGGPPVLVKWSRGKIWCGGTFSLPNGKPGAKADEITIDPAQRKYGSQNNPPPDI